MLSNKPTANVVPFHKGAKMDSKHVSSDDIRSQFSTAMSEMYQAEVPQYGTLMELVSDINAATRLALPELETRLIDNGEVDRLNLERHGAIRLGTAQELNTMRRLFWVMGMSAVGYYDLSVAGVPVHSTAFRPTDELALRKNPFRVFTSLLRLDLIDDEKLRKEAADILAKRTIYTSRCLELIDVAEKNRGLTAMEAEAFVAEALETFRWHREATVPADVYQRLRAAHPLIADVVCFKGPHINHLTPRTLDIDAAQAEMIGRGLSAKAVIEGPPRRQVPILLRQTSFKALQETVAFRTDGVSFEPGGHTARFGEIEQRGVALTPKGRALYDRLLVKTRDEVQVAGDGGNAPDYMASLGKNFQEFPDSEEALRRENLAYFRYVPTKAKRRETFFDLEAQISNNQVRAEPLTYEDFLPVSAAGIFRSNLGDDGLDNFSQNANRSEFEKSLGGPVIDPDSLYQAAESASKRAAGLPL
jgi:2-oxoadipate dioxygenase/decarboxylase